MTRLSVNINKVALIRNARGGDYPDLLRFAADCERFGAQGITVHPRPDERHIRYADIPALREIVTTEFNIEGNPTPEFLKLVCDHPPHQCTLVPDAPDALTSDSGWDTIKHRDFLRDTAKRLQDKGVRVSIFVGADEEMVAAAAETGVDRVEFYTGPYAHGFVKNKTVAIKKYVACAAVAAQVGLGINAGHDFNLDNLAYFKSQVPNLLEVSIGHALISDALYYGIHNTVQMYLKELE